MKTRVQRFGKFLSAMVMPNIGILIAFGFMAALFIDTGWMPNKEFSSLVGPLLTYLIPIFIAASGGKLIAGEEGRVVAAIAVMGAILKDTSITMLMAAMIIGPLAGYVIKIFNKLIDKHLKAGFEMLVKNFSIGIIGMLLALISYLVIGPLMSTILNMFAGAIDFLIEHKLLPFSAIFIEPAKVLFLNNAINHGIFTPIASAQAASAGQSIMFMLETNPGPGLGVLLAYLFFAKNKITRNSSSSAIIIHLLGGIHEIYFPYILMNPFIIIAPIIANMTAIFFYNLLGAGLSGPPSPGSIIAFLALSPGSQLLINLAGIIIATVVSFLIAAPIVRLAQDKSEEEESVKVEVDKLNLKKIIFACDAGMGSSAMGATKFRNKVLKYRNDLIIKHSSVDTIDADTNVVVVQRQLVERARKTAPKAQIVAIDNFLDDPKLVNLLQEVIKDYDLNELKKEKEILVKEGILLNQKAADKYEAIKMAGKLLSDLGYTDESYTTSMLEREELVTTYMGLGVAIPHGTSSKMDGVKHSGIVMLQFPEGVNFGEEKAYLVFGIAAYGNKHLDILSKLALALEDKDFLETLKSTDDLEWILDNLSSKANQ